MKRPLLNSWQRIILRHDDSFEADKLKAHLAIMNLKRELDRTFRKTILFKLIFKNHE